MDIVSIVAGIFFIAFSFVINTKDFVSALLLKVLPFFSGLYCLFLFCLLYGIIKL